jgi:hypothetical protein
VLVKASSVSGCVSGQQQGARGDGIGATAIVSRASPREVIGGTASSCIDRFDE